MAKMKKFTEYTFDKGEHTDDELYQHMRDLNLGILTKPKDEEGNEDDWSYNSVLSKKIRIVIYVES
jgi:hypothetical protein